MIQIYNLSTASILPHHLLHYPDLFFSEPVELIHLFIDFCIYYLDLPRQKLTGMCFPHPAHLIIQVKYPPDKGNDAIRADFNGTTRVQEW